MSSRSLVESLEDWEEVRVWVRDPKCQVCLVDRLWLASFLAQARPVLGPLLLDQAPCLPQRELARRQQLECDRPYRVLLWLGPLVSPRLDLPLPVHRYDHREWLLLVPGHRPQVQLLLGRRSPEHQVLGHQ